VGFRAVGLSGLTVLLAHVEFSGKHRVGRYGVDVDGFEAVVRNEFDKPEGAADAFVIDEIGKMECLSRLFIEAISRVWTVPSRAGHHRCQGEGFISHVKRPFRRRNHDGLADQPRSAARRSGLEGPGWRVRLGRLIDEQPAPRSGTIKVKEVSRLTA